MRAAALGLVSLLVSASAGPSQAQTCATEGEWSYEGTTGPSCWANLSRDYEKCSGRDPPGGRSQLGPMQSPVLLKNTDGREHGYVPPPGTMYRPVMAPVDLVISKVHHTVRLDFAAASGNRIEMTFDPWSGSSYSCRDWAGCNKDVYELQELHFHAPSEHTFVENQKNPLEAHLVHKDPNWPANWPAKIFVLGLLFEAGQNENPLLTKILANRQSISETPKTIPNVKVNPLQDLLFDNSREIVSYQGSKTTPPCTERIGWWISTKPVTATQAQIDLMAALLPASGNARPLQPLVTLPYSRYIFKMGAQPVP